MVVVNVAWTLSLRSNTVLVYTGMIIPCPLAGDVNDGLWVLLDFWSLAAD